MWRLRLQVQPEESKDPIEPDKLLRPHPNKRGIKTRCKEDPRDTAVGSAKEQAGAAVTAGSVQLPGKFVPNLAAKTQDLRALVKKNAEFVWEETHTKIFEALNAELKDNMTLQYFDPQKEIIIECDASQKGLGACLL